MNLDLAVIGNSITGALIDRHGRVVWCCYPRLDGDPIFCHLLDGSTSDADAVGFADVLIEDLAESSQSYERNTAVLTTVLTGRNGAAVRIIDFMPRFKRHARLFRPTMLMRRIEPVAGSPRIRVRVRPRFDYGATKPSQTRGSNHIRYLSGDGALRLTTDAPLSFLADEIPFVLDSPVNLVLGPDEPVTASLERTMVDFLDRTREYWIEWTRYLAVPFDYQDVVIRAAITLKLCSYEESGAILAALTTSIPEAPGSGRNWDYRACWLRDSYFVVQALNRLGATLTMEDFIRYITNVSALDPTGRLKPVYGIVPAGPLGERTTAALPGYRGMGPVRVGNLAEDQTQNDSYGSVVLAAAQMFFDRRLPRMGDQALFHRLERIGEQGARAALTPDSGLWEFRGRQRVHTYSAVMCWAGCDRLAKIADLLGLPERAQHWRGVAVQMRQEILAHGFNPELNSFVDSFDGRDIDASLLLLQEVGFVAASDPRYLGTVAQVERVLRRGDHLFRYAAPDDFGVPDTAFTICTFWYIDALTAIGRHDEARAIFERVLACRNHVGLLSEDIDPRTGELWGNLPQTYSMVGMIISAMRLSRSWEAAFWRGW
jgi:GH15 family glucan-1,4-alpha-glucosidase